MEFIKNKRKLILNILVFAAALLIGSYFFSKNSAGTAAFTLREGTVYLSSGSDYSCEIPLSHVTDIFLLDDPNFGEPADGGTNKHCRYGIWQNEAWGEYRIVAETKIQKCIVLSGEEGFTLFNYESEKTTESLYRALREYTGMD